MNFAETHPNTLEEAVALIVADMRPEDREYVATEGLHGAQESTSPLAQHFRTRFGLGHADDMSGMIFRGIEATVRGFVVDPDAEAEVYRAYWRKQKIDPLTQEEITK